MTTTTRAMLPTSTTAVATSRTFTRGFHPHPHRRRRRSSPAATAIATFSLFLATSAWLSLIFSSTPLHSWHRLLSWDHHLSPHPSPHRHFPLPPTPPQAATPPNSTAAAAADSALPLSLRHIIFGIAGSAHLWPRRKEFVSLWWRPGATRGHVWMEEEEDTFKKPYNPNPNPNSSLPPIRISEDTSLFRYTNPTGHPSGLRISRIVTESFRLGHRDVRWFVLCDDDTILNPDNLVLVLSKYDWREMVYVGGPSESHSANTYFSHSMAFGGGGIAISYPLAEALATIQDDCLERYPRLYGSDDRLHACISELGVPLTRERGFHQWDIRGNAHGLLAAHPIAPFLSIHHVESVDPFYPGLNSLESLNLFTKAMKTDPSSFLQRAICYDRRQKLTFSVSLGYVVQVFPNIVLPRELERSEQTYIAWNRLGNRNEFDFDTRDTYSSVCKKPILFFLKDIRRDGNVTVGSYMRANVRDDLKRKVFCFPRSPPLHDVKEIRVLGNPLRENWHLVPRRLCCKINRTSDELLGLDVGQCKRGTYGSVADSLLTS